MSSSSSSTPEPLDPNFQLRLPSFEGPLDLLLHLCQKHELDILNLPVAFVTERYLDYIRLMERLDLDVASEYLVMAATLAHIKSKMLLPQEPEDQADDADPEDEIDPRQELIRRLLEYQKYKAAAEELGSRGVAGRDVFFRGMEAPEATGPAPLAGIGLFKLLDAFQVVLKRAKQDLAFQITAEGVTIQDRMTQLADTLRARKRCTFDELFADVKTIYDIVVTFLAILEMAKRRLASVYQTEPTAPIHLEYKVLSVDDEGAPVADPEPVHAETIETIAGEATESVPDDGGVAVEAPVDETAWSESEASIESDASSIESDASSIESDASSVESEASSVESDASIESTAPTDELGTVEPDPSIESAPIADPEPVHDETIETVAGAASESMVDVDELDRDVVAEEPPPVEPDAPIAGATSLEEELGEERVSEPGVAIESELVPSDDAALEADLAPPIDGAIESTIDPAPVDEEALDPEQRGRQDSRPSEPDET